MLKMGAFIPTTSTTPNVDDGRKKKLNKVVSL